MPGTELGKVRTRAPTSSFMITTKVLTLANRIPDTTFLAVCMPIPICAPTPIPSPTPTPSPIPIPILVPIPIPIPTSTLWSTTS